MRVRASESMQRGDRIACFVISSIPEYTCVSTDRIVARMRAVLFVVRVSPQLCVSSYCVFVPRGKFRASAFVQNFIQCEFLLSLYCCYLLVLFCFFFGLLLVLLLVVFYFSAWTHTVHPFKNKCG